MDVMNKSMNSTKKRSCDRFSISLKILLKGYDQLVMRLTAFMYFYFFIRVSLANTVTELVDLLLGDTLSIKECNAFNFVEMGFLEQLIKCFFNCRC